MGLGAPGGTGPGGSSGAGQGPGGGGGGGGREWDFRPWSPPPRERITPEELEWDQVYNRQIDRIEAKNLVAKFFAGVLQLGTSFLTSSRLGEYIGDELRKLGVTDDVFKEAEEYIEEAKAAGKNPTEMMSHVSNMIESNSPIGGDQGGSGAGSLTTPQGGNEYDRFGRLMPPSPGADSTYNDLTGQWESKNAEPNTDASTGAFWDELVAEWQDEKENMRQNDLFRKEQMTPAFDTYQQRLSGMSQEPTFSPINLKFGDFQHSFMPKRATENADSILRSELARTDIMQPNRADSEYLDKLSGIAQFQEDLKLRYAGLQKDKDVAEIRKREPDDKGGWLDTIVDIMDVGKGIGDIYNVYKG